MTMNFQRHIHLYIKGNNIQSNMNILNYLPNISKKIKENSNTLKQFNLLMTNQL